MLFYLAIFFAGSTLLLPSGDFERLAPFPILIEGHGRKEGCTWDVLSHAFWVSVLRRPSAFFLRGRLQRMRCNGTSPRGGGLSVFPRGLAAERIRVSGRVSNDPTGGRRGVNVTVPESFVGKPVLLLLPRRAAFVAGGALRGIESGARGAGRGGGRLAMVERAGACLGRGGCAPVADASVPGGRGGLVEVGG